MILKKFLSFSLFFVGVSFHGESTASYLRDRHGALVRSGNGDCIRTGAWTPSASVEACTGIESAQAVTRFDFTRARGATNSMMESKCHGLKKQRRKHCLAADRRVKVQVR